jgi:Holliday junction resolvase RusA-like endonuclease
MTVSFVIPGKPFGKKRHRVSSIGGKARAFNPDENTSFEQKVAEIARPLFPVPFEGPVKLRIVATFEIPASWSKKKQAAMMGGYHVQKPDRDNVDKAVQDGLNRIAFRDDSQVADGRCVKRWGRFAETYVEVGPLT